MSENIARDFEKAANIGRARSYRIVWITALTVALLQGIWSAGFIYRTSFVVEGQRYFCLFDDAMISMRYASNWADGNGFVWNPGERVEGYTTFLWTAIMGLCHLARLSPSHTCLLVQILGILTLWGIAAATVLLCRACRLLPIAACCAVVMAGTFYNLMFFTLFGMETGLLTLLMVIALADSINCLRDKTGGFRAMLWFGPAMLVRPDVLPIMLFIFAFLLIYLKRGRYRLTGGLCLALLVVLLHALWRHSFYGDWLPNTFYLKATGWPLPERIVSGIKDTIHTAVTFWAPVLFATAAFIRPKKQYLVLAGCFIISTAYQVYVGGDAWPLSRFVIPMSIGVFVLAGQGIHNLMSFIMNRRTGPSAAAVRIAMILVCIAGVKWIHWDHILFISRPLSTDGNWMNVKYVHAIAKTAGPDTTVAVTWAGVFPYFSKLYCIDLLGKCDSHIAHLDVDPDIKRAGHNKYDLVYSLNTYKPDIVLHLLYKTNSKLFKEYQLTAVNIEGEEIVFSVRNGCKKVKTDKLLPWSQLMEYLTEKNRENKAFQSMRSR